MQLTERKEIAETYGISLADMVNTIAFTVNGLMLYHGQEPDLKAVRLTVLDFMMQQGEEATIGMYGFIRYIQTSDKSDEKKIAMLNETLQHDLNERKDKWMLPRSSGYKEFANR